jgi:hypothetical protein
MSAELAVIDTVNRFHLYVDRRDWPSARECLADQVQVSLGGTGGQGLPADRFLGMIRSNVESFAATQHLVIGHHIRLDRDAAASCAANYVNHHVSAAPSGGGRTWSWWTTPTTTGPRRR